MNFGISQKINNIFKYIGIIVLLLLLLVGIRYHSRQVKVGKEVEARVLEDYNNRIKQEPFNGELLLQASRHIYHFTRERLQEGDVEAVNQDLIERALGYYRRLVETPVWELEVKDYFFNAYLYYQLGQLYSSEVRGAYNSRALDLALEAYENDFRSPELVALLGNLYYEDQDYETAINYYEMLGETRDPVLLLNNSRALLARKNTGDPDRAEKLLEVALRSIETRGEYSPRLYRNIQATRIRVSIKQENFGRAFRIFKSLDNWRESDRFQTLYAEYLIAQGRDDEARDILKHLANREDPYQRAVELFQKISS